MLLDQKIQYGNKGKYIKRTFRRYKLCASSHFGLRCYACNEWFELGILSGNTVTGITGNFGLSKITGNEKFLTGNTGNLKKNKTHFFYVFKEGMHRRYIDY